MKLILTLIILSALSVLAACTLYDVRQTAPDHVASPKPLVLPVSKDWQMSEETPVLSNERERLPFQTEQSVQPRMAKPVLPDVNRTIETPR